MEGSHKLKNFDLDVEMINQNLSEREKTGCKSRMSDKHEDYIKKCVVEGKVRVEWVESKETLADIFTKPFPSLSPKHSGKEGV